MFKLDLSQRLGLSGNDFQASKQGVTGCVPTYYRLPLVPSYQIDIARGNSRDYWYENLDRHVFVPVRVSRSTGQSLTIMMILKNRHSPGSNLLMRTVFALLFGLLSLTFFGVSIGAKAASGPFAVTLDGDIIHIASGFSFPNKIGNFQRVMTRQYDTAGQGVSVGYEVDRPRIAATIYVYPSNGRLLETEFVVRENGIVAQHQDTRLVDRGTGFVSPKKSPALVANYEYTDTFAGKVQPLRSRLLVARRGDWNIEYRFTYAASEGANGASLVDFLQNGFVWPEAMPASQSSGAAGKKGKP